MDLEQIAPILEQIIKESLEEKRYPFGFDKYKGIGNKVASGKLRDSVQVNVQNNNNGQSILQVIMIEYAEYVQQGRKKGKKGVPIQPLLLWIKERNLKGRDKKGRFITNLSLAYAIQSGIKKHGIRPANFIDVSIEKVLEDPRITDLLGEAGYEELINAIEGI
jgi:hypothetical protein